MDDRAVRAAAMINDVQGHLLVAATLDEARETAVRLTGRMPWLTDSQQAELERLFEEEYVSLARTSWQRTAQRAGELRAEYQQAYRVLRRRLVVICLLVIAGGLPAVTAAWADRC